MSGPLFNSKYKTKLCKNYQMYQTCPYHSRCQFAHGMKELEYWKKKQRRFRQFEEYIEQQQRCQDRGVTFEEVTSYLQKLID